MKSAKRKTAKRRTCKPNPWLEAAYASGAELARREAAGLAEDLNRPVTRAFLINLAAAHAALITADKQGLDGFPDFDRFRRILAKATGNV